MKPIFKKSLSLFVVLSFAFQTAALKASPSETNRKCSEAIQQELKSLDYKVKDRLKAAELAGAVTVEGALLFAAAYVSAKANASKNLKDSLGLWSFFGMPLNIGAGIALGHLTAILADPVVKKAKRLSLAQAQLSQAHSWLERTKTKRFLVTGEADFTYFDGLVGYCESQIPGFKSKSLLEKINVITQVAEAIHAADIDGSFCQNLR